MKKQTIKGPFTIKAGEELPKKIKDAVVKAGYKPPFKETKKTGGEEEKMTAKVKMIKLASGNADGSGDATANSKPIHGRLLAVHLVYDASSAATTDVQLDALGSDITEGADLTLLDIDNNNTSAWYFPREYAEDKSANDLTYDGTNEIPTEIPIYGRVKITVAQQTEGKGVTAYLLVEAY